MVNKDNLDYDFVGIKCVDCQHHCNNYDGTVTCNICGVTKLAIIGQFQKECPLKEIDPE